MNFNVMGSMGSSTKKDKKKNNEQKIEEDNYEKLRQMEKEKFEKEMEELQRKAREEEEQFKRKMEERRRKRELENEKRKQKRIEEQNKRDLLKKQEAEERARKELLYLQKMKEEQLIQQQRLEELDKNHAGDMQKLESNFQQEMLKNQMAMKKISEEENQRHENEMKKLKEKQNMLEQQKKEDEIKKKKIFTCNSLPSPPLIGLQNIGSTCYMNATLQCFSHTEVLTNYFLNENNYSRIYNNNIAKYEPMSLQLSPSYLDLINNLWKKKQKWYPPTEFRKRLADMNSLFKEGTPNDAKDLLTYILMQLHDELNLYDAKNSNNNNFNGDENVSQYNEAQVLQNFVKSFFGTNKSVLSDHFFGIQESKFLCLGCAKRFQGFNPPFKYNFQTFNFLIFPLEEIRIFKSKNNMMNNIQMINNMNLNQFNMNNMNPFGGNNIIINNIILPNNNNNSVTIYDCFNYFQKEEIFQGDNAMWCNDCNGLIPCKNNTIIYTGPNILIIILNRGVGIQFKVKLEFYESINLDNYIAQKDRINMIYDLYGVVTHLGESGASGHFVAACKSPCKDNRWYRFNDAIVTPINNIQSDIINFGMPYILFYKKRA